MSTERAVDGDSDIQATSRAGRGSSRPEQPAEHALLALLKQAGGTAHGYDLARKFRRGEPLGDVIHLEQAMLYKHLKKLVRLGWITMSLQDQSPRPPRQVCCLTPAGERELQRWLAEPVGRTREIRLEFLVKLFFAWQFDPALAHRLASEQREIILRLADSISSQIEEYASQLANPDDEDFGKMVLQLRLEQTVSAAHWLERVAQAAYQQDSQG